jgi:catechol 2,3-dioxygenase-like lactoylglutathione lyase family enzyme
MHRSIPFAALAALALGTSAPAQTRGGKPMAEAAAPSSLRVSNIILRVSDVPRSVSFYRDRVGMAVRFSSEEFASLDGGGVQVLLNKPEAAPPGENGGLSSLTEIVLEAPDVHASFRALQERGVPFKREPRIVTTDGQRDLLAADFRDPDGHVLSLTGWVPKAK